MENNIATKQHRSFGLIVGGIFVIIGLWPVIFQGQDLRHWAIILAALLMIPALVYPKSLDMPYRGWMAVGQILGWINTRIILGIIFYGVVTPIGLIMRLLGKDSMHRRFEPEIDTYRVKSKARSISHLNRQF